jgi:hypothetical protein
MMLFLFTFLPIGLPTVTLIFLSLRRYQKHSVRAYIFHTGGASIEIYGPSWLQQ